MLKTNLNNNFNNKNFNEVGDNMNNMKSLISLKNLLISVFHKVSLTNIPKNLNENLPLKNQLNYLIINLSKRFCILDIEDLENILKIKDKDNSYYIDKIFNMLKDYVLNSDYDYQDIINFLEKHNYIPKTENNENYFADLFKQDTVEDFNFDKFIADLKSCLENKQDYDFEYDFPDSEDINEAIHEYKYLKLIMSALDIFNLEACEFLLKIKVNNEFNNKIFKYFNDIAISLKEKVNQLEISRLKEKINDLKEKRKIAATYSAALYVDNLDSYHIKYDKEKML